MLVATIPKHVDRAFSWYGEKEIPGPGSNNFITDCLKTVRLPAGMQNQDETPWCSALVSRIMLDCGLPSTESGLARSWLDYGEACGPRFGAITVLWRVSKSSQFGHVGFLIRRLGGYVYLLGGNQSNQLNIGKYPEGRVLDYRYPIYG